MNLIWIVSDTLRRDALGAYGNDKMHTPSMLYNPVYEKQTTPGPFERTM